MPDDHVPTRTSAYFDEGHVIPMPVQPVDALPAFVRARLDERELMLRTDSPAQIAWATFLNADGSMRYTSVASSNGDVWVCDGHAVEPDSLQVVFDRAQELADVAAKRQIIEQYELAGGGMTGQILRNCLDTPIRLLALPFAGHPEFREEWRP